MGDRPGAAAAVSDSGCGSAGNRLLRASPDRFYGLMHCLHQGGERCRLCKVGVGTQPLKGRRSAGVGSEASTITWACGQICLRC